MIVLLSSLLCLVAPALAEGNTVRSAFPPPAGAERVPGDAFGDWLGALPLYDPDSPVLTWSGRQVEHRARVVDFPLVTSANLQQCADTAIRLRAEWLKAQGRMEEQRWYATSGQEMPWSRYVAGERPVPSGNRLVWRQRGGSPDWESYLKDVFMYAGTISLKSYETVPVGEPRPGDMLVEGGSPGHAVVLFDVARQGDQIWLLIGEGYMPAQQLHIELGPQGGWWPWSAEGLELPHWRFKGDALRRWK